MAIVLNPPIVFRRRQPKFINGELCLFVVDIEDDDAAGLTGPKNRPQRDKSAGVGPSAWYLAQS